MNPVLLSAILDPSFIVPSGLIGYIDAGTGSYIFQMIVASLLAGVFALKQIRITIMSYLGRLLPKRRSDDTSLAEKKLPENCTSPQ